jgi:hypothetical protein
MAVVARRTQDSCDLEKVQHASERSRTSKLYSQGQWPIEEWRGYVPSDGLHSDGICYRTVISLSDRWYVD